MGDEVNHPDHYAGENKHEPIEVIIDWDLGFCLGNVIKYVARHMKKGTPLVDLKKARFYLDRAIKQLEESDD